MDTPNPSRQRKNAQKRIARKGKSEKRYGGSTEGGNPHLQGWGRQMSIPSEHQHNTRNKKSNRNRLSVKAKHKKRLKKNG